MRFLLLMWLTLCSFSSIQAAEPPIRPDPNLTPGATLEVTREDICTPGYAKKVRNVPQEVKRQVFAEYGILSHQPGEFEVDHLISLELGGSNSIRNLWPESYRTEPWNARVKDRVENKLHEMVCRGQIDLKQAQQEIASDWIAAYKKFVGPEPAASPSTPIRPTASDQVPAPTVAGAATAEHPASVWVNTRSGVFWRPGTAFYGRTKQGKFLSEREATAEGFRPAKGQ